MQILPSADEQTKVVRHTCQALRKTVSENATAQGMVEASVNTRKELDAIELEMARAVHPGVQTVATGARAGAKSVTAPKTETGQQLMVPATVTLRHRLLDDLPQLDLAQSVNVEVALVGTMLHILWRIALLRPRHRAEMVSDHCDVGVIETKYKISLLHLMVMVPSPHPQVGMATSPIRALESGRQENRRDIYSIKPSAAQQTSVSGLTVIDAAPQPKTLPKVVILSLSSLIMFV